jgi:hypothetical protein
MLLLEENDKPYIHLSKEDCNFEIKGNSYSVLIDDVYNDVANWVTKNIPEIDCEINWKFQYGMISSASLKGIIKIIEELDKFHQQGKKIRINWISPGGDTDIIEIGEDMEELTTIPFDFIQRY